MRTHRFTLSFLPVLAVAGLVAHHGRPAAALGTTAGKAMVRLGDERLAAAPGVPSVLTALAEPAPLANAATPSTTTTTTTTAPAPPRRPADGPPPTNAPPTAPVPVGPRQAVGTITRPTTPSTTTTTPGPVAPSATVWAALRRCESGDDYGADTGNGYFGAYQFSLTTWRWLGYPGFPDQASPATQDAAAVRLETLRGWSQWPACARTLGLG
ncbi:MAG: transglycosylase family protein [Actinomycetota bacterium]|jgi:hypothetical protein|nr:transglycosylase family protein [Actinomycetota bacterium]